MDIRVSSRRYYGRWWLRRDFGRGTEIPSDKRTRVWQNNTRGWSDSLRRWNYNLYDMVCQKLVLQTKVPYPGE